MSSLRHGPEKIDSRDVRPVIAVTAGDCAGIGPEVLRGALADERLDRRFRFHVLGLIDAVPGKPDAGTARAAMNALESAVALGLEGKVRGVVTGPVSKHLLQEHGFAFPGQTEFFADRCGIEDFVMMLTGGGITVALATAHIPLARVAASLSPKLIIRAGRLVAGFVALRKSSPPRIAIAGLNPHAGENGTIGTEEGEIIAPAVRELNQDGTATFEGPVAPDTLFFRLAGGEWDAAVAMYHDQGLIPLKLHAFHEGVNVTLGLPFPRTSPDHGTAFEIAGRGMARHDSMLSALNLAAELAAQSSKGGCGT